MKAVPLGRPIRREIHPRVDENLFAWTVFILLLCGFALTCWIGTLYIFSHPEIGFAYKLLNRLHKLDPPRRFELTAAPSGEFLGPDKLLQRYGSMNAGQLTAQSDDLLRSYLRNYDHQVSKLPYITGKFTVLDAIPLQNDRFFNSGVAVIAQSIDVPAVLVEHLFPASKENLPAMQHILVTGLGIDFRRSYDLSAIIHVKPIPGGRLLFTCVPLLYGPYGTTQSGAGFRLEPPRNVNVEAGLPVAKPSEIQNAEKRYAEYRRATGIEPALASFPGVKGGTVLNGSAAANGPTPFELVPIARALPVVPDMAAGSAKLSAKSGPKGAASFISPTPSAKVASVQTATAKKEPAVPRAELVNPPVSVASPNPSAAPVLTTAASPSDDRIGSWSTYRPGQMPRGRVLEADQTADLADHGLGRDPVYLRGDFVVTAARENRAVLRPKQSLADRMLNRGNVRVIVEVPRGLPTPPEGENLQRGTDRPFQIMDIRRGADGQLNVFVREVTTP